MPLLSIDDLTIGFRGPLLLDGVSAQIEPGQRIGLLGRNGAGKSTLMKILAGELEPDSGALKCSPGVTTARLTQDVPDELSGTIESVVRSGDWTEVESDDRWQVDHQVESTLSRMELGGQTPFETLSSGMKRRVLLARAIAQQPDLLLLDEPTNHLDLSSILWLESFLKRWSGTLLFVTHDRAFLQNLADRIWEIDRGRLFDWSCDYPTFLTRKEAALAAEEKQNALFDKKLAEEEAWIRRGIQARRTRNEGRVRALKTMRVQRRERQDRVGNARLRLQEAERSGALVADVEEISFAYGDRQIVDRFTTTLMRGDRVGIVGPNGSGKTTLLRLLLGQLQPDSGNVRLGTNLQIAYFDQLRDTLDPDRSVQDNVAEGSDKVRIGDKTKHVLGYLQDFLFTPERARSAVRFLSGGERNRVLLAKLMTRPANVIVLDEPTNDLDSETLELLEDELAQFGGTLLLVSHDRTFLDNIVTSTIVFEDGQLNEYVGGYEQWQATVARRDAERTQTNSPPSRESTTAKKEVSRSDKKLSYNEQRELDTLPDRIESIESEIARLHDLMGDPEYYQGEASQISTDAAKLKQLQLDLETAYARWEELESSSS